ncbi:hypothetical protein [Bifidobacterium felsineum]|uniref:hypothetical protein n=1 Tax=Bifidobacterium felsineum TaxID=2045440 RepID=UPI001BDCFA25|nr:hypothetical protein [Bifidobacterium felsineum]MBT1164834.1 hypothetical protein [Bifidobacterium felsineum]
MVRKKIVRETGTFARHMGGGYIRTVNGNAWLYMRLPDQPSVSDAAGAEERLKAARPLLDILTGLADMTPRIPFANRKAMKGLYRRIHILAVSASRPFEPSPTLDEDNRIRLKSEQQGMSVRDRFTLIGVRLNTGGGKNGWKSLLASVADEDGWTPDSAFDADRTRIRELMERCGCRTPSDMTMRRALAFWPTDRQPEALPVMVEHDHMHTFPNYRSAFLAARYREKVDDCKIWSKRIPGSYPLTVCTLGVLPFKGEPNLTGGSDWAATLLNAAKGGAVAISVKGLVEPGELSREQIDKDTDKVLDKAYEQATGGRKANLSVAQELQAANDAYQADGKPWPTLVETHAHAAIPSIVEQSQQIPYPGKLTLNPDRQDSAFEDMQIGSDDLIEYDPSPCYWPAPILAFSGLYGTGITGDDTGRGLDTDLPGALVGYTEEAKQPVYDSLFYASRRSAKPVVLVIGSVGSGKRIDLDTPIPIPPQPRFPQGGLIPLRDIREGDLLYSRDGKPYAITGMSPVEQTDMYEITFSDGQQVIACGDHQWAAWTERDRNFRRTGKHQTSLERRAKVEAIQKEIRLIASGIPEDEWWTQNRIWREIATVMHPLGLGGKNGGQWVYDALHLAELPSETRWGETRAKRPGRFHDPVPLLEWLRDRWTANRGRMAPEEAMRRVRFIDLLLADPPTEPVNLPALIRLFAPLGLTRNNIKSAVDKYPGQPVEPPTVTGRNMQCWPARRALQLIADRIGWRYVDDPDAGHGEQVVTTRDMLNEGLLAYGKQANWAIRVTKPVEGEHMSLPLDPWVLGAWLADGSATSGGFASDPNNGDLDHAIRRFEAAGFPCHRSRTSPKDIYIKGLVTTLRRMNLYGNKHIPEPYFHASIEQRLELVRGLLDQDGSIDADKGIEFCQTVSHKPIIDGLTRLLRGLGVKVHEPTRSESGYTIDGTRHRTQDRLRITFTTTLPVFSLERKKRKLPKTLRETQQWLYVKDIKPVGDRPSRCLSIDSPDHTYLIQGCIPTHNTRLGLHITAQWGRLPDPSNPGRKVPIIFFDPKPDSDDFEPFVRKLGGVTYKLDRPEAKGMLDPFRCIPDSMPDMVMQTAVAMLSQITGGSNPNRAWEMGITSIIGYGMRHHANGIGDCVDMAWHEYATDGPEKQTISPLIERIKPDLDRAVLNDPLMPLIYASGEGGARLNAGDGFTLISAGHLNVITDKEIEGAPTDVQRWVCRMAALAASCLVIGRNGAVVVDEAWSLLQDRFGRSIVNRMGRLARAQHYILMMLSQKADEFVDAGIEDFVGKTYVLAIGARNEGTGRDSQAQAACRLANQPLDGRMHARMMHDRYLDPDSRAPDWESLYPLKDPKTGKLLRGSVAYMQVGDAASAIPVEVRVDKSLA